MRKALRLASFVIVVFTAGIASAEYYRKVSSTTQATYPTSNAVIANILQKVGTISGNVADADFDVPVGTTENGIALDSVALRVVIDVELGLARVKVIVDEFAWCSSANPSGVCPAGQVCSSGTCQVP